jgi:TPR repeat protein
MTRLAIRIALFAVSAASVLVGGLLLRNYQMDEGIRALKSDNGYSALARFKPLAALGDRTAQTLVGSIYAFGWGGVSKNDTEAIYWFRRCGPVGPTERDGAVDRAAQAELVVGKSYATGEQGVKVDPVESAKWLKLAAKGGSKEASALLAQSSSR